MIRDDAACDVAILGGGPAGSATALSLRQHAPTLSVVLVEKSRYEERRIGETLPPPAKTLLTHLGVWDDFQRLQPREVFGVHSSWGSPAAHANDFIFSPHSTGWHLDRAPFDAMLARSAEIHGARVLRGTRVHEAIEEGGHWHLRLSCDTILRPRFVVDATGRRAVFARRRQARFTTLDRLVGFARFFSEPAPTDPGTHIEAFRDGWWYTAGLASGLRICVCMTDADIARRLRLQDERYWFGLLRETTHIKPFMRDAFPEGPLVVRPTESRCLEPAAGENWLAVGDTASQFDPLSSQGIMKALRSGIFASYAIADLLVRADPAGLGRFRRLVSEEFASYANVRTEYYCAEQRWPEREFWKRRSKTAR